ncbi:MAG: ThuA domain-containing protein [Pseudomonadales bacterium]
MRQVILSGGIFHDFSATSQLLAQYAAHLEMTSVIVDHPADAIALIDAGGVDLLTVNALHWPMAGEKYDPYREAWRYDMTDDHAGVLEQFVVRGGGLLGLHTASICFSDWPLWGTLLGGRWVWGQSFHPDPGQLSLTPTSAGVDFGLESFVTTDERYTSLELSPEAQVLMVATDAERLEEPLVWRKTTGEGRAAYSGLGHDVSALSGAGVQHLMIKLMAWLVRLG